MQKKKLQMGNKQIFQSGKKNSIHIEIAKYTVDRSINVLEFYITAWIGMLAY